MCTSEQLPEWFLPLPRNISAVKISCHAGGEGKSMFIFHFLGYISIKTAGGGKRALMAFSPPV